MLDPSAGGPVVERGPLPPPEPGLMGLGVWVLALGSMALIIWAYARIRKRRPGEPQGFRQLRGGAAVGNAFMDLNAMLQADRPVAAEIQKLEEEDERDDRGDGRDPGSPRPRPDRRGGRFRAARPLPRAQSGTRSFKIASP